MSRGDPFRYFRVEAGELVEALGRGVLDLDRDGPTSELIGKLFRLAHTLKGAARVVKHRELAELSHALETALQPYREGSPPPPVADLHAVIDAMAGHVAAMAAGTTTTKPPPIVDPALPVPAPPDAEPASSTQRTMQVPVVEVPEPGANEAPPVLRAEVEELSEVLDGLSEIHVQLAALRRVSDVRALPARIDQLEREVRRVRGDAERLQLVPARTIFTALERTARDATTREQRIAFTATGGEMRLAASVLATVHGALVQLVRNAVAHGVEPAAERRAAGKPEVATIAVAVSQHGSRVAFKVTDDGRGIDLPAVRRELARSGAPVSERAGFAELLPVLLRGGVSTAAEITELAGRGVGLDVARDAAAQLGGEITGDTRPGAGTWLCLTVPVSLATMDVLRVRDGDREAALPLAAVRGVARVAARELIRRGDQLVIARGDDLVPYAPLAQLLGGARTPPASLVYVAHGDELVAAGVDHILGVREIVHRARPPHAPIEPVVSGLMLDDDGRPLPVLDPRALCAAIRAAVSTVAVRARPAPILVVDDSLTTRMLEQSILESAGYDVELASSAEEGLERAVGKLAAGGYSLCLVDVEMPGMSGFEFIATLRARSDLAATPAILVTSRNEPEDHQRAAQVGANGYIVKGQFDQGELLSLIGRLLP